MLQETRTSLRMLDSCKAEQVAGVATVRFRSSLQLADPGQELFHRIYFASFTSLNFASVWRRSWFFSVGRGRKKLSYNQTQSSSDQSQQAPTVRYTNQNSHMLLASLPKKRGKICMCKWREFWLFFIFFFYVFYPLFANDILVNKSSSFCIIL